MVIKKDNKCLWCGIDYFGFGDKFCSYKCMSMEKSSRMRVTRICLTCGNSFNFKASDAIHKVRKFCSHKCVRHSEYTKKKIMMTLRKSDKQVTNWKGGVTKINNLIRHSSEYKEWREKIFSRDKYTCVMCDKKGGRLQADHIKPFAYFPELRFSLENGRTLCIECHKKTDTWGEKAKKYENALEKLGGQYLDKLN